MTMTQQTTVEVVATDRWTYEKLEASDVILDVEYYGTRARVHVHVRNGYYSLRELAADIHDQFDPLFERPIHDDSVEEIQRAISCVVKGAEAKEEF